MPTLVNLDHLDFAGAVELTAGQVDASADFVPIFDADGNVVKKAKPNNLGIGEVAGVIKMYGGSSAPSGYLLCDGSAVSRTTYAALFAAIGTTWGVGDGSTTFNLPDFRGQVPGGVNNSGLPNGADGSFSTRNEADTAGAETHTLTESEIPSHDHPIGGDASTNGAGAGGYSRSSNTWTSSGSTNNAGGGGAHNTMQPTLFCNFIIATGN